MDGFEKEELLKRLEEMRESLEDEHGAEREFRRGEFNRELQEHALDLGLAWLDCVRKPTKSGEEQFDFPPRGKM